MSDYTNPRRYDLGRSVSMGSDAWYGAASQTPAPPIPSVQTPPPMPGRGPTERQRKKQRRTKVVALLLCFLLLSAAVAMVVLDRMGRLPDLTPDWNISMQDMEDFFQDAVEGFQAGDDGVLPEIVPPDDGPYSDFREYFEDYYITSGTVDIPRAPTGTGVKLDLRAPKKTELSLQEIYAKVSPAVVGINAYVDGKLYSWATGVVFTADGYVITNTHVLQGCTSAEVVFADGSEYDAKLVGADDASDIAVLVIDGENLPYVEFGRSDALQVGDKAVAIGNPLGQEYAGTMTDGIISAIDRSITYDGHTMTLLQTNAALNEGNSGGPLINAGGQVIGITNMKIMSTYYASVEGIGFAIPSAVVKQIADQIIEKGYVPGEPTIGIVAGSVGQEAMALFDLPNGVYVSQVNDGSDAKEKGVREGDVITAVNGESVSSVADVNLIKEGLQVGDTITLTIYRDGETFDLEIVLVDKGDIR